MFIFKLHICVERGVLIEHLIYENKFSTMSNTTASAISDISAEVISWRREIKDCTSSDSQEKALLSITKKVDELSKACLEWSGQFDETINTVAKDVTETIK